MRKSMTVFIAFAVLAAGGAAWADTTTVTVNATVTPVCKFTATGSISFVLDPSVGGNVPGTIAQPTFWCTKSVGYAINDDIGQHANGAVFRMQHATILTEFIPYSFTYTAAGTGAGPSSSFTMDIASMVTGADYASAAAGSYSDTVTLTITP